MTAHRLLNRRMAVLEMGKAGLPVVVFGAAACSGTDDTAATTTTPGTVPTTTTAPRTDTRADEATTTSTRGSTTAGAPVPAAFQRVNLDFVSAYILYRGGEAALVDTGVEGSADAIEAALGEVGRDSVGQVILTHKHPDLEIISSPGHTAGHICVLDRAAGILIAGDALVRVGGGVGPPDPSFSDDMSIALESVRKLAGFPYEMALFGHGEPLLEGASAAVAALAEG